MKYWNEIKIRVKDDFKESVVNLLFELGTGGCWEDGESIISYFDSESDIEKTICQINCYLNDLKQLGFQVESNEINVQKIEEKDWNSQWKKNFKPIHVSDTFVVKPTWIEYQPRQHERVIEIDPKMAFGTGTHETTQLMIQLMDLFIKGDECVLDIGTGTGILAIAARYLGAEKIYAFDNDPLAAECIRENIIQNGVEQHIKAFIGVIDCIKSIQFDVILANINKRVILQIFNKMAELLKESGVLIVSGLIRKQSKEIIAKANEFELCVKKCLCLGEWEAVALKCDL